MGADWISFWSLRIQISTEQQYAWTINRYFVVQREFVEFLFFFKLGGALLFLFF